MLPVSNIAENMSIAPTTSAYLVMYGPGSYFQDELADVFYVIGFNQAFNEIYKKGQMDLKIRFCVMTLIDLPQESVLQ